MTPSSTIGHYRIVSKLGEGGMGAVYRATDTKLNRDVAIKVLPDALANDPDYLERFTREAQVLASLNHPNIATIHGVEDRALVMELVPGETLAERIARGPIPVEEALPIARQIAEAVEAAHEKGVIHRDLKPGNVKVTPEGVVKVLDFGLAKAAEPAAPASGANSPTLTLRATHAGIILGTAAYMAPEQAAGKVVDRRADIWSFGVTLYEMLTGKMLFTGETISHTLASVLKEPIDFDAPHAPAPIRRLLAQCLERNPKERLRDIGDARLAIRDYLANPAAQITAPPARARRLPWIASAVLFLALLGALGWIFKPAAPPPITRFRVTLAGGEGFLNWRSTLAISPDGSQMAYVANRRLYLRSMSELDAHPIPGALSEMTVTNPAFSPDGKSLAFYDAQSESIKRIAVAGGAAVTLCSTFNPYGLAWTEDGILYSEYRNGILRVSPNGGQPVRLVASRDKELIGDIHMLPGGKAVLFATAPLDSSGRTSEWDKSQVVAEVLSSHTRKTIVPAGSGPAYLSTGYLVYFASGILFAAPFDAARLETTGSAVGIVEGVARSQGGAQFAFSGNGSMIYVPGPVTAAADKQDLLTLVDRNGIIAPLEAPSGAYLFPRVSKDGKRVAYQVDDGKQQPSIWVWELSGATAPRRLTLPGAGANRFPVWSPDGQRIAFQSDREGDAAIWWQRADGSGLAERLTTPEKGLAHIPDSWAPDGQTLSFTEEKSGASAIWTWSLRDRKAALFAAAPGAYYSNSAFSPDSRWIAYQSSLQPNSRIYVRPFPTTGTAYLAPEDADTHHPLWSPDGRELFYVAGPGIFGRMNIATKPTVSFGPPVRAPRAGFETAVPAAVRSYDILPDGKRFIGVVSSAQAQPGTGGTAEIRVILNWFWDVKQRVPLK